MQFQAQVHASRHTWPHLLEHLFVRRGLFVRAATRIFCTAMSRAVSGHGSTFITDEGEAGIRADLCHRDSGAIARQQRH